MTQCEPLRARTKASRPNEDSKTNNDAGAYAIILFPPAIHERGNVVSLENTIGQMFLETNIKTGAGPQGKVCPAYESWVVVAEVPDDRSVIRAEQAMTEDLDLAVAIGNFGPDKNLIALQ